ncbi:MAG: DUF4349 domain-containing protein [Candidatus Latescibacterota bacterium]
MWCAQLLLAGCLAAWGLGCTRGSVTSDAEEDREAAYAAPAPERGVALAAKRAPAPSPGASQVSEAAQRLVVKTAQLELEVAEHGAWAQAMGQLVDRLGGFIVSAATRSGHANVERGELVVRVPAARFEELLAQVRASARRVESEEVSGQDVTEEFYDLKARLDNHRRTEERFRQILQSASKVEDVLAVERELARVREEIEVLEGRQRYLADRIALCTVTVQWHEPYPVGAGRQGQSLADRIGAGFARGVQGLAAVMEGLIAFVVAALPVVVFVGLLTWGAAALARRRRGGRLL